MFCPGGYESYMNGNHRTLTACFVPGVMFYGPHLICADVMGSMCSMGVDPCGPHEYLIADDAKRLISYLRWKMVLHTAREVVISTTVD